MRCGFVALAVLVGCARRASAKVSATDLNYYLSSTDPGKPFIGEPIAGLTSFIGQSPIEIDDWSWDVEQTLNIQAASAGAGKITFNPFSFSHTLDSNSPSLLSYCAGGSTLSGVTLSVFQTVGNASYPFPIFQFKFGLVAIKTIQIAPTPNHTLLETVTFDYGGVIQLFTPIKPSGSAGQVATGGWDAIKNVPLSGSTLPATLKRAKLSKRRHGQANERDN